MGPRTWAPRRGRAGRGWRGRQRLEPGCSRAREWVAKPVSGDRTQGGAGHGRGDKGVEVVRGSGAGATGIAAVGEGRARGLADAVAGERGYGGAAARRRRRGGRNLGRRRGVVWRGRRGTLMGGRGREREGRS